MARDYPLDVQNVGDDSYCFMSKGHHEPHAFMAAVAEWCADAPLSAPKHLWVKAVPCRCGEHSCHYELSDEARKGWFPATYTWETYGADAYKPPATSGVLASEEALPPGVSPSPEGFGKLDLTVPPGPRRAAKVTRRDGVAPAAPDCPGQFCDCGKGCRKEDSAGVDSSRAPGVIGADGRLTPHGLWREKAIWLLDALTDATRELRDGGELEAMLAHLDKHPSLTTGVAASDGETVAREAAAPLPVRVGEHPTLERWGRAKRDGVVLLERMDDGYWTPWHIAQAALAATPQAAAPADGDTAFLAARLRRLFEHFKCQLPQFADDDARLIGIAGSVIGALLTRLEAAAWTNIEDAAPPCDGHTVFIGINSAGYACCFNAIWQGQCVMETAEGSYQQMSDLRQWCRLERPTP